MAVDSKWLTIDGEDYRLSVRKEANGFAYQGWRLGPMTLIVQGWTAGKRDEAFTEAEQHLRSHLQAQKGGA